VVAFYNKNSTKNFKPSTILQGLERINSEGLFLSKEN